LVEGLGTALKSVADERREADEALVAKNRAIDSFDSSFAITAGLLSALLEAAGQTELARRVRPSRRKSGQTEEPLPADPTSDTTANKVA